MTSEVDDRSLVRESLRGDSRAFETLVERYYKVLYNIAFRMVNDSEDALDITQATFMKAYDKLSTYDPKYKFFSWIYRIMTNESLNFIGRRRPQEPLDLELAAAQKNPQEEYEGRRLSEAVQSALMRLSPDHRQVLVLRHFVTLSYKEISSALGLPEKTVKSRLFAARRQLGAILVNRSPTT